MHTKLAVLRKEMRVILDRRRELLNLPAENEDATGRVSMAMQLFISILAAALVLATAIMLSFAGPESSGAIYGSISGSANASQISSGESRASAVMAVLSYSPHIKGSGGAKGMFSQEELRIAGDFLRAVIGGDITLSITLDPVIRWPQSLWISLSGAMTKSGFNHRNPEHLAALQSLIDKASDAHMRAPKAPRP
jgi:hypothetical protein